jgi:hypothetical protein
MVSRYLHLMFLRHPFSILFGVADTRDSCATSSVKVFRRLLRRQKKKCTSTTTTGPDDLNADDDNLLDITTLADVAVRRDGSADKSKLKKLIHLFRPNNDGKLTVLEFIKVRKQIPDT